MNYPPLRELIEDIESLNSAMQAPQFVTLLILKTEGPRLWIGDHRELAKTYKAPSAMAKLPGSNGKRDIKFGAKKIAENLLRDIKNFGRKSNVISFRRDSGGCAEELSKVEGFY